MSASLVGSEMCIRDSCEKCEPLHTRPKKRVVARVDAETRRLEAERQYAASEAAKEVLSARARER
eukprot:14742949-Alexandrium_andersonii.AAC.1